MAKGEVNFYLKKPEPDSNKRLIYLQFKYEGKRLVFSFGQRVTTNEWNSKKQQVKSSNRLVDNGTTSLNLLLDTLKATCKKEYNEARPNGIPSPEYLKEKLRNVLRINEGRSETKRDFFSLLDRFINNEITHKGKIKSPNTVKTYVTLKGHLLQFQSKGERIDFNSINLDFYHRYNKFLDSLGLSQNSKSKDIQIIKTIMREAIDLKLTDNKEFESRKFSVNRVDTESVYLNSTEIETLFRFDFSNNKKLERVRDLFIFGCLTGLRFSDYANIKKDDYIEIEGNLYINRRTQKTGEVVITPCTHPFILEIFSKYLECPNKLPPSISGQKFNDYLKEVCKIVGFTETGRNADKPEDQLWECVTSHTARRSFATNAYLEGFPTLDIMKMTGHRTEKAFLRYIKISKLDTAKRYTQHTLKVIDMAANQSKVIKMVAN